MQIYSVLRKLLFQLPSETAHELTFDVLSALQRIGFPVKQKLPSYPIELFGKQFDNPVGLAAGLDKNGDFIDILGHLGFGFIEVGTVTPKKQLGNPKPRMFRLEKEEAIINRMGFNNEGIDYLINNLCATNYKGIIGVNIGKNKDTPEDKAINDYVTCLHKVFPFADYVTINISSPNTPGLRKWQAKENLKPLLHCLKEEQQQLSTQHKLQVPLLLKISPDLTEQEVIDISQLFLAYEIDGVIATNTTISRHNIKQNPTATEIGGLSGKPLEKQSNQILKLFAECLNNKIPIIGVGGVHDTDSAYNKIQAGAKLVQIYTSMIYSGPKILKSITEGAIAGLLENN